MARKASHFRQRDVKAAAVAARQAGVSISSIEVSRDGVIKIIAGKPEEQGKPADTNEWDTVLGEN